MEDFIQRQQGYFGFSSHAIVCYFFHHFVLKTGPDLGRDYFCEKYIEKGKKHEVGLH